ncbi:MAG TPA: hypothetical protein VNV85_05495 [Puia sp.]|jgi:hypothetical protein|nr:hypothetical protein [Puia sp.]
MKFISSILLTALLSFVAGIYLPWWSIAVVSFVVAFVIPLESWKSFLSTFLGVFLLWATLAWWIDSKNNSILSRKIAQLLMLGGSSFLLILVTALIGALVAGLAGLTASYCRKQQG